MGLQLLDTLEKPESCDFRENTALLAFKPNFPLKKKSSKNKNRHAKPKNYHNNNEVVSPDNYIFQDQTFCTGTQNMFPAGFPKLSFLSGNNTFFCGLLLLVSYKGKCLFVYSCSPFFLAINNYMLTNYRKS